MAYLEHLIARKRMSPGDDLISELIRAELEGDRLSPFEVVQVSANLMLGGYETTMGLIGNGVLALLQNPEQLERLRVRPALARAAVEEVLRYDSPFIATVRVASEPLEVGGRQVGKGEILCLLLAAANRDPEQFVDPDRFDITREAPNIAFGGGVHACLGAALARLEGEVVFQALARRLPRLALVDGPLEWRDSQITRILTRLPVRC
jgi:cytochrome P450